MEVFKKFIDALISKIEERQIETLDDSIKKHEEITDYAEKEYIYLKEAKDLLASYRIDSDKLYDLLLEFSLIGNEEEE